MMGSNERQKEVPSAPVVVRPVDIGVIGKAAQPQISILMVGGESNWNSVLRKSCMHAGISISFPRTKTGALNFLGQRAFDIAVLDIADGQNSMFEILTAIHEATPSTLIIVLSDRLGTSHRIRCFDSGADDYIQKPILMREFLSRIGVLLRRTGRGAPSFKNICLIELSTHKLSANISGSILSLTSPEWCMLDVLARKPGVSSGLKEFASNAMLRGLQISMPAVELHLARLSARLAAAGITIVKKRGRRYLMRSKSASIFVRYLD